MNLESSFKKLKLKRPGKMMSPQFFLRDISFSIPIKTSKHDSTNRYEQKKLDWCAIFTTFDLVTVQKYRVEHFSCGQKFYFYFSFFRSVP